MTPRPTRSSVARIIRHGQRIGDLPPGTGIVGMAAYVRGYRHGSWLRSRLVGRLPMRVDGGKAA